MVFFPGEQTAYMHLERGLLILQTAIGVCQLVKSESSLPRSTEIVVVGGGIAGVSTAYHLAKAGVPVVLCEKGRIAREQSSRNWGWVRVQGRDPREIPAAMQSLRLWRGISAEIGSDIGFHQGGVLYVGQKETDMEEFESWFRIAQDHGLDTSLLSGRKAHELLQHPRADGKIIGALYTPSDGRAEPELAVPALAAAASKAGATIRTGCAVRKLVTSSGRISGVATERGVIDC